MKNLKRALSLVLSTAMLLGMMVVGTGAGYADVDSNDNVEAIEVLKAAEIMIGDGDDFNPDDKVTREQMAVIMCNILDYNVAQYKGTAPFSDISDWAEPYVAACYTHGIVAGIGNGKFGGQNDVSAAQAALMLMKALGYFQYQQDFGDDWQLATVRQGAKAGLYAGIDSSVEASLTRNEIAQMVLNALEANMVEWYGDLGTEITTADGTEIYIGYNAKYEPVERKPGIDYTVKAEATSVTDVDNTLQLIESLYGNQFKKDATAAVTDAYGRPAVAWKDGIKSIGTFAETPIATYTKGVSKSALYELLGKTVYNEVASDKAAMTVYQDGRAYVVADGDNDNDANATWLANYVAKNNSSTSGATGNGTLTEVYVNNDGDVTIVMVQTYVAEVVSDYNEIKEQVMIDDHGTAVALPVTLDSKILSSDDFDNLEDLVEGDFLLINIVDTSSANDGSSYTVDAVAKAEVMTGVVDSYEQDWLADDDGKNVTVDGTTYSYSALVGAEDREQYVVGEQASFVMDEYGYVIAVADAKVASNFAYVLDIKTVSDLTGSSKEALLIFADGTKAIADLNKVNGNKTWSDSSVIGNWVYYSKNSSGEYNLNTTITGYTQATTVSGNTDASTAFVNGDKVQAYKTTHLANQTKVNNKNSVLIVIEPGYEVSAYTGVGNMPEIKTTAVGAGHPYSFTYITKDSNPSAVAYAVLNLAALGENDYTLVDSATAPEFIFVLNKVAENNVADGNVYYTYNTLMPDGTVTKTVFENADELAYSLIYKTSYNADGRVTNMTKVPVSTGAYFNVSCTAESVTYNNGALEFGPSGKSFIVTEDTKIVLVSRQGTGLNKDAGATYEINEVNGAYLPKALTQAGKTSFDGFYAGQTVEAGSEVLDTLYIYVSVTNA